MSVENHTGIWLKPSEALNRFSMPGGWSEETGEAAVWDERRYGFAVGNVFLLIARGTPSEMPERADIHPLPGVPFWFRGLLNLRGTLVPVFDVAAMLEGREERPKQQGVLILDRGEMAVGILIAGFPQAAGRLRPLAQRPPVPQVLHQYAPDALTDGERVWLELDHRGFFRSLAARFAE